MDERTIRIGSAANGSGFSLSNYPFRSRFTTIVAVRDRNQTATWLRAAVGHPLLAILGQLLGGALGLDFSRRRTLARLPALATFSELLLEGGRKLEKRVDTAG